MPEINKITRTQHVMCDVEISLTTDTAGNVLASNLVSAREVPLDEAIERIVVGVASGQVPTELVDLLHNAEPLSSYEEVEAMVAGLQLREHQVARVENADLYLIGQPPSDSLEADFEADAE